MKFLKELEVIKKRWEPLGCLQLDRALLVGHIPHEAPQAYLLKFFNALNNEELVKLSEQIHKPIPQQFIEFYKVYNGLRLFLTTFSIYGYRQNYKRTIIENSQQPFSLADSNNFGKPKNALPEHLFIGGYDYDGSLLYTSSKSDKIFRCKRNDITPLNEWNNLDDMLCSEIPRIAKLYDDQGKLINPNQPTTP